MGLVGAWLGSYLLHGALSFHGQQQVGEQGCQQFFGGRHQGRGGSQELDGVDVGHEVVVIVGWGVGEGEVEACWGASEAGVIHPRGDQRSVRIAGVK